jgi:hypothetical protein
MLAGEGVDSQDILSAAAVSVFEEDQQGRSCKQEFEVGMSTQREPA